MTQPENLPVCDTVTDVVAGDKTGVLRDLARRASHALQLSEDAVFAALAKREELARPESAKERRSRMRD